jgi:hypothetical protein
MTSPTGRSPAWSDGRLTTVSPTTSAVEPPPSRLSASCNPSSIIARASSSSDMPTLAALRPSIDTR